MVRRAAAFLVINGPVTLQDRWEEDPGYAPFTLAAAIAALLAGADLADAQGERGVAGYLRETADVWNDAIEDWCYVTGTELARRVGVDGYYVRITPPDVADAASPAGGFVPIKNRPPGQSEEPASQIISPDALALVRFGLRAPDDPRIVRTGAVIDALLKIDTPRGPAWHRYNDDDAADGLIMRHSCDRLTHLRPRPPCSFDDLHLDRDARFYIVNVLLQLHLLLFVSVLMQQQGDSVLATCWERD